MSQHTTPQTRSARIREELGYPVIDGDGHVLELIAVFADYVRDKGQGKVADSCRILNRDGRTRLTDVSLDDRRRGGLIPNSWHVPASTEYFATVADPSRYHERLGEAGIDFAVLYPTTGIAFLKLLDDEQRVVLCRLYNEYMTELYGPYADRFTVAALIPMNTPEEAVDALTHAKSLGAKVGLMSSHVRRPRPGDVWPPNDEWASRRVQEWETSGWVDTFGLDSMHDYDPVWAKSIEVGIPLAAHNAGIGFSDRSSVTNFVYNQIGHFAASGGALAKSLFLGGVTRRFPDFRLALLEGGAAIGVQIYVSLVANWHKRSGHALSQLDPNRLDRDLLVKMLTERNPELARFAPEQLAQAPGGLEQAPDDYAAADIHSEEDIRDRFCRNFYWGCEADDPFSGLAFDSRITPLGAKVPAFFASDLGHWDVPDFDEPLQEAYELVEREILDAEAFRDFVFANPVRFYGSLNPDFFKGTVVERAAADLS